MHLIAALTLAALVLLLAPGAKAQPASAPASRPAARPGPAVDNEHPRGGPGAACRVHSDCKGPMFCIKDICRVAPAPGAAEGSKDWDRDPEALDSKGKMTLGGQISISIISAIPDEGDSVQGYVLTIAPSFGYLAMDGLEIGGRFHLAGYFGDLYKSTTTTLGFGPKLRLMFGRGVVMPYVSMFLGPMFYIPEEGDTATMFVISPGVGILVALSKSLGLSIGIHPTFAIGASDKVDGTLITVPIGALGIEGFL